jgi:hypothetical protein
MSFGLAAKLTNVHGECFLININGLPCLLLKDAIKYYVHCCFFGYFTSSLVLFDNTKAALGTVQFYLLKGWVSNV